MIVFVKNTSVNEIRTAQIGHLPPSVKLVYKVLETRGQLTQKDLVSETSLPSRTVRYALNRLKDENVLVERHYLIDARQSLYCLKRPVVKVVAT